ncbi:MFS general substrate transporter [Westerdykella ornata]|uniref:MFS general substrate transporter n=1 Tax=Westerdykella ornata TaxID=318751 RepID=A0A6A6JAX4_WESOR|nr:MFS general substrate transporter [Westerdykella ornata]KAF2273562.1 MFS general substrate transporter [Westerdykella ornata]
MTFTSSIPVGLPWRSSTLFVCTTVGLAAFTDMFLYGIIVPVLPFMLQDRIHIPDSKFQSTISMLLAVNAGASCLASPITGVLADKLVSSRQLPFLLGLAMQLLSTILLAVGQSVPVLVIARFLQGAAGGVVWTIGMTLLVETVGQQNLGKTIGTIFSFCSVATLFAPIVGGLLYEKAEYKAVFGLGIALLVVDFIMRVLMIEKRVAAKYMDVDDEDEDETSSPSSSSPSNTDEPDEQTSLLPPSRSRSRSPSHPSPYKLPQPTNPLTTTFPLLLTLLFPPLPVALLFSFVQAFLIGAFDATVPLVASASFSFTSLSAGLLFFPLGFADFFLSPVFGAAVDTFGTRPLAVAGFSFLALALATLGLPFMDPIKGSIGRGMQILFYAVLLAANGVGMAVINSTSIVESGRLLEAYFEENRDVFGGVAAPPYAQLYGLNTKTHAPPSTTPDCN